MMRSGIILLAALGASSLLLAACGQTPTNADGSVADADPVRCETIRPTGSRLGKRVCLTEAEWEVWTREQQERAEQMRRPGQPPEARPTAGGG